MKLVYLAAPYRSYLRQFYGRRPRLGREPFRAQLAALDADAFAWVGAWGPALARQGFEVEEILCNVAPLQRAWARENAPQLRDLQPIAIEQAVRAKPEVVLYDHYDQKLLREIKARLSRALAIGWSGGTPPELDIWKDFDLVLSCAPEAVDWLRGRGVPAEHLHHGFNDRVLPALRPGPATTAVGFFGQIVTSEAFHGERERFLEQLIDRGVALRIHSPSAQLNALDDLLAVAKMGAWAAARMLRGAHLPDAAIRKLPIIGRGLAYSGRPSLPVSRKLRPHLRQGKFGVDLFNAIAATQVTLNVHANASIRYASNMRLFETTGAGGCLLTDWKENIPELFEPEREIVTYRSLEECVEKIDWLLAHPAERAAIGRAAQARTLAEHTYGHRARRLADLIRRARP